MHTKVEITGSMNPAYFIEDIYLAQGGKISTTMVRFNHKFQLSIYFNFMFQF